MLGADYLLQIRIGRKTDQILLKDNLSAPSDLNWAHSPAFNKLKFYLPNVCTAKLPPGER